LEDLSVDGRAILKLFFKNIMDRGLDWSKYTGKLRAVVQAVMNVRLHKKRGLS